MVWNTHLTFRKSKSIAQEYFNQICRKIKQQDADSLSRCHMLLNLPE